MTDSKSLRWFDAHLDLACLAIEGRDLSAPLSEAQGPPQPPAVTFGSLRDGRVVACCGTIFTAPDYNEPCGYPGGDAEEAHRVGRSQWRRYVEWDRLGLIRLIGSPDDLAAVEAAQPGASPLGVILLMEGADPVRSPKEVEAWANRGLRAIGLSWARGTRYAGGNGRPGPLTALGRELVAAIDAVGLVHDLSHLPDESAWELLEQATGPVMASHSNSRTIAGESERHLSDALIEAIGQRGGMVGLNLFGKFITPEGEGADVERALDHIDRIASLMGRRDGVGLGSDMDGGFGADRMIRGVRRPKDLEALADGLARRGWSQSEIDGFRWGHFVSFWRAALGRFRGRTIDLESWRMDVEAGSR